MSQAAFSDLMEKFCALVGLDRPERIVAGDAVEINGVEFNLVYNESVSPETLFIYCDMGPVPEDGRSQFYEALLEANMLAYPAGSPAFMLSPETGHVLFACNRRLVELAPEALCELLSSLAAQAKVWDGEGDAPSSP